MQRIPVSGPWITQKEIDYVADAAANAWYADANIYHVRFERAFAEYRGRKAGSFGDTGTFSFHGSKTLTTGEGGMLVTDREDIYRRAAVLRDHGRHPGDTMFFNSEIAYKYKMSSMQAALGLAQLERVEELVARKRQIFDWYQRELGDLRGVKFNHEAETTKNTYWMVTVLLEPELGVRKEQLIGLLAERGIDCRPFFHPLSSLPPFASSEQGKIAQIRNRVSYGISPYGVN